MEGRAYKTCTRELITTRVWPLAAAVEGESVGWGRNASPGLVDVVWRCPSQMVGALRLLGLGSSDVQPEATVVLAVEPAINSLKSNSSTSRRCPSTFFPCLPLCLCLPQLPVMSGQQCLRRLPCALRAVPAVRTGARAVNRLPAARNYSAVSRASSSGLLGQASRFVSSWNNLKLG